MLIYKRESEVFYIKSYHKCQELLVKYSEQKAGRQLPSHLIDDTLQKVTLISKKAQTVTDIMNNVMHATIEELESISVNVDTESLKKENV